MIIALCINYEHLVLDNNNFQFEEIFERNESFSQHSRTRSDTYDIGQPMSISSSWFCKKWCQPCFDRKSIGETFSCFIDMPLKSFNAVCQCE